VIKDKTKQFDYNYFVEETLIEKVMLEVVLPEHIPSTILNILVGNTALYHYHVTNLSNLGSIL